MVSIAFAINAQTMNDETLKRIGRKHDVADIIRVYEEARAVGHENINMDLILGLPEETPKDVKHTMQLIQKLKPDNVTVHTLAVKRASRLKQEFDMHTLSTAEMLEANVAYYSRICEKNGVKSLIICIDRKIWWGILKMLGIASLEKKVFTTFRLWKKNKPYWQQGQGQVQKPLTKKQTALNVCSMSKVLKIILAELTK